MVARIGVVEQNYLDDTLTYGTSRFADGCDAGGVNLSALITVTYYVNFRQLRTGHLQHYNEMAC